MAEDSGYCNGDCTQTVSFYTRIKITQDYGGPLLQLPIQQVAWGGCLWYQNWIPMRTQSQKFEVTELWLSLVHLVHHRFPKVWISSQSHEHLQVPVVSDCYWMLVPKAEMIQDSPKGNQWLHQGQKNKLEKVT